MSGPRKVSDAVAKRAVPILLTVFVLSLVIDNAFKYVNQPIADSLGISLNTAGLQATIPISSHNSPEGKRTISTSLRGRTAKSIPQSQNWI